MFSYKQQTRLCTGWSAPAWRCAEQRKAYDDSVRADDDRGREQNSRKSPRSKASSTAVCPDCDGTRLNPVSRAITFHGRPITVCRALVGVGRARVGRPAQPQRRDADIARDVWSRSAPLVVSRKR